MLLNYYHMEQLQKYFLQTILYLIFKTLQALITLFLSFSDNVSKMKTNKGLINFLPIYFLTSFLLPTNNISSINKNQTTPEFLFFSSLPLLTSSNPLLHLPS